jgi:hypothetical protein
MDGIFPAVFVLTLAPRERRSRLAETLLPAMVPVAASQRIAVAAIAADQQIRDAELREQRVVSEVVTAIDRVAAKPAGPGKDLTDDDVKDLPVLSAALRRQSGLRMPIAAAALVRDQVQIQAEAAVAEQAVKTVEAISQKYVAAGAQPLKLTAVELQAAAPQLDKILTDPVLRGRIV